jgi:hypothetical protein
MFRASTSVKIIVERAPATVRTKKRAHLSAESHTPSKKPSCKSGRVVMPVFSYMTLPTGEELQVALKNPNGGETNRRGKLALSPVCASKAQLPNRDGFTVLEPKGHGVGAVLSRFILYDDIAVRLKSPALHIVVNRIRLQ